MNENNNTTTDTEITAAPVAPEAVVVEAPVVSAVEAVVEPVAVVAPTATPAPKVTVWQRAQAVGTAALSGVDACLTAVLAVGGWLVRRWLPLSMTAAVVVATAMVAQMAYADYLAAKAAVEAATPPTFVGAVYRAGQATTKYVRNLDGRISSAVFGE